MTSLSNAAAPNKAGRFLTESCRRRNLDPHAVLAEIERRRRDDNIRLRSAQVHQQTVGEIFADGNLCDLADAVDAMLLPRQTQRSIETIEAFLKEREAMA